MEWSGAEKLKWWTAVDRGYLYILLTVAFTVLGQLILKYEVNLVGDVPRGMELAPFLLRFTFRPWVLLGLFSALVASLTWIIALTRFELNYAYPFMSLNFLLVVVLSFVAFGEQVTASKLLGLGLICAGVVVVSKARTQLRPSS